MRILDTLSNKKIEIKKSKAGLKLFVCGPTVYDYSHIGHARTYIVFDSFVKYLRFSKNKVFYLQNITDIDDKIINRAKNRDISPEKLAKQFEKEYYTDMKALNINSVNKYAPASKHIKEIQKQITVLLEKNFAYETKNGVYFQVKKFTNYGNLSKQNLNELRHGYRIEQDPQKKDPLDFSLWKRNPKLQAPNSTQIKNLKLKIENCEPFWPSPWGWGRPGWHIEDTAITEKIFGSQYDIHGGANDLKFPHHESEIAQQESISGKKPFVKIWMHTGFLLIKGDKMSKSLNNFITIREFLKKNSSSDLRMIVFSHHYRSPVNYNDEILAQAKKSLNTIEDFMTTLKFVELNAVNKKSAVNTKKILERFENDFKKALDDDFNTPKALSEIFNLINHMNHSLWKLSKKDAMAIKASVIKLLKLFEINTASVKIPLKIAKLAQERHLSRQNKQFVPADRLRIKIERLGYLIKDTPLGPMVQRKS